MTKEERLRWAQVDPEYIKNNFPGVDPDKDFKRCEVGRVRFLVLQLSYCNNLRGRLNSCKLNNY